MAHPTDVLQLSQLFTATLEPLPLRHFDLEHRPSALSLGEWRSGQTGWSTVQLVEPCSSADAKTHGRIFVLLKDLELLISNYYARVLWRIDSGNLCFSIYLVPSDLTAARSSGLRKTTPTSAIVKALRRLFPQLKVHEKPLLNQIRCPGTLLDAWNAVPSPPDRSVPLKQDHSMHLDPWQHETLARMYQQEMPFGLQKTLFDYQRNDLASMLLSERRERPALDITYSAISDEMDRKYWINVDFDLVKEPGKYPLPPGGILANMPGSGKSLELISLIAATKNRIAPPATELTGFGPFVPEIEAYVPLHQSQESRAYIPSLLETCVRVVREKTALSSEDITSVQSTSAAEMLAGTELTFKRPDPVLFKDLTFPSRRSSQRTNEHWGTRDLHNMPSTVTHISKTSLIVVPANLIDHWKEEIETAHKHQLSYEKARKGHGDKPIREWTSDQLLEVEKQFFWTILTESDHKSGLMRPAELAKFDLLLMSELVFQKQTRESPLHQVHYARLAFDEALFTSSNKARGYENATALSAHARWTISATPTRNLTQNHEELQAPDRPLDETLSNQKDREDLDRLGLIASFLRMLPFTLDRTHFPHWVTQAFVIGHGYASIASFLNHVVLRTHPERVRSSMGLPELEMRTETLTWGHVDRLCYNVILGIFCANSILSEREGPSYLFGAGQREHRDELLHNFREAHMFFANPNLAAGAEFAINNINERLEKKDLSEVDHADLIRALKHLKEACASRQFREVCKSDDACLVVQGLSDVVSRAYDVNADFIMRSVGNYQNGALIPSIRVSHMRLALGLLRSRSDEDTQWKTADDLEEELTTAGLKQLEEMYKAEHPSRFKKTNLKVASKSTTSFDKGRGKRRTSGSTSPKVAQSIPKVKVKKPKPKPAKKEKPKPLFQQRALPVDTCLTSATVTASVSAKLNFIVDEVQSSHPEDAFIVFSESKLTLACVAQAMEICNISCVHNGDGKKPSPAQLRGFKASGGSKVLLLEPKHGGRGLHLTRANRIIFASPCWNKDDEAQATLRSHRIGQRRKVTVQLLVMENSFEAALLRRRNQLNDVQQEGAKVQHYRNEADDDQLRWRLEHAAFIEPTPGEEHLHSFNLWKQACKLIPQEARQNPSGSPDAKRTSEPPKKKRKTKSSSSATKVSPEDTDLASAASTSTYTVPPLLPSRNASAPGRSALKRKIDSASDHADDDNGPCMRKRARVGVAKAVHFSV